MAPSPPAGQHLINFYICNHPQLNRPHRFDPGRDIGFKESRAKGLGWGGGGSKMSRHSLLNLLLALLFSQATLGFLIQIVGQLLLVGSPLLLRRHFILCQTTDAAE